MATKRQRRSATVEGLLQDLLIAQLGAAGLKQAQIREIVGVDIHRVNRIVKHLKNAKRGGHET